MSASARTNQSGVAHHRNTGLAAPAERARAGSTYGAGGRLEHAGGTGYRHDGDGNQSERLEADGSLWQQRWNAGGMLSEVVRPDGQRVRFGYDAFARRMSKQLVEVSADEAEQVVSETRFLWDQHTVLPELGSDHAPTTWYWDPGSFTPILKDVGGCRQAVASDHLGAPTEMCGELGELRWSNALDVFGALRFGAGDGGACAWRRPVQYDDAETGLRYNRHRYYGSANGASLPGGDA